MKQEWVDEIRVQLDDLPAVVGRAYVRQHMFIVLDALEAAQADIARLQNAYDWMAKRYKAETGR